MVAIITAVRTRRGFRTAFLAGVTALVALVLPWSSAPRADALVPSPVKPVVTIIDVLGGRVYTLPAGVAAGDGMTLVAAGVGAYQGTCMILGVMFDGSCDAGGATDSIYNLLTTGSFYGRLPSYTGPAGIVNLQSSWTPTATNVQLATFTTPNPNGSNYVQLDYALNDGTNEFTMEGLLPTCLVNKTIIDLNANSPAGWKSAYDAAAQGQGCNPQQAGYTWSSVPAPPAGKTWVLVFAGLCANSNLSTHAVSNCVALKQTGFGPATTHTATITETCTTPGGTTFTRSTSVSWVPTANGKSPDAHLPNCWDITPGSVRTQVGASVSNGTSVIETATENTVDPTRFPNCVSTKCALTPKYVPTGVKCFNSPTDRTPAADCVDLWREEPNHKNDWQCWYGEYRVAISVCLQAYPLPYFETGNPTPDPSPSASPSAGPTTTVAPLPTTGVNPIPDPSNPPTDGTAPSGDNCWGSGWSWNPISWVYVPVKCALVWAAVPPAGSVATQVADLRTQASTRAPFSIVTALGTAVQGVANGYSGAGGCGLLADFSTSDIHAPITCAQIRAVPGHGGLYALVSAGIWGAVALSLYRLFASYFESNNG